MQSITEIRKKIQELESQASEIMRRERDEAVAAVKQKISEFQLTLSDLGLKSAGRAKAAPAAAKSSSKGVVKYRRGSDQWTGGRGPKPKWVKELLAKGEDIEKYRV